MFFRRDDWVFNNFLQGVPNASVQYLTQPTLAPATIYNDANGDALITNPQTTDGFGHAVAYMAAGIYTIIYSGPQILTLILPDQTVGTGGGGGNTVVPFAGVPVGPINGVNTVFTMVNGSTPLTSIPTQSTVWLNVPLISGVGYTLAVVGGQVQITYTNPPQPSIGGAPPDFLYAQGVYIS